MLCRQDVLGLYSGGLAKPSQDAGTGRHHSTGHPATHILYSRLHAHQRWELTMHGQRNVSPADLV